jgi:hypothetical protein
LVSASPTADSVATEFTLAFRELIEKLAWTAGLQNLREALSFRTACKEQSKSFIFSINIEFHDFALNAQSMLGVQFYLTTSEQRFRNVFLTETGKPGHVSRFK